MKSTASGLVKLMPSRLVKEMHDRMMEHLPDNSIRLAGLCDTVAAGGGVYLPTVHQPGDLHGKLNLALLKETGPLLADSVGKAALRADKRK